MNRRRRAAGFSPTKATTVPLSNITGNAPSMLNAPGGALAWTITRDDQSESDGTTYTAKAIQTLAISVSMVARNVGIDGVTKLAIHKNDVSVKETVLSSYTTGTLISVEDSVAVEIDDTIKIMLTNTGFLPFWPLFLVSPNNTLSIIGS